MAPSGNPDCKKDGQQCCPSFFCAMDGGKPKSGGAHRALRRRNPDQPVTQASVGSATAGLPSTQWMTFLGHLATQVPQPVHLV